MFGLKKALENFTYREFRNMFKSYNKRSWHRLMKDFKEIKLPNIQSPFGIIHKQLLVFKPLKLKKFF